MEDRAILLEEFLNSIRGIVIVEGIKDKKALESLGVENIVQLHAGNSMLEVVEKIQGRRNVAILTDLDQNGKILRRQLLKLFSMYGIMEDRKPREILAKMRVSYIEGLK
ncbi:MAG: toprim domain-containing protein [Candidatus Altiarchaeales archaeon]|nr:toprim domain-containing protein [Candidatus Altiarchaeales archaeon]